MLTAIPDYWKLGGKPSLFSVSEIFHENSKIRKGASSFVVSAEAAHAMSEGFKSYHFAPAVALPAGVDLDKASLGSCILSRKSVRNYSETPLTLSQISTLLAYCCRTIPGRPHRPAPSAGALFPLEIYPLGFNVQGLERDVYHYDPRNHSLEHLHRPDFLDEIRHAIFVPEIAQTASAIFVITAVFGRTKIKYGERGYRFTLLEAGHIAQNLCLVATAMEVGTCVIGGYVDDAVNEIVDIDGVEEASIYLVSVGNGACSEVG